MMLWKHIKSFFLISFNQISKSRKVNSKGLYTIREYYKNNLTSMTEEFRTLVGCMGAKHLNPSQEARCPASDFTGWETH